MKLKPGDLVFFDNDRGKISHVGMIIAKGLVIHASGRVRIDSIDHQGIFKPETGGYSQNLRTIRENYVIVIAGLAGLAVLHDWHDWHDMNSRLQDLQDCQDR